MKPARVGSSIEWHQDLAFFPHTNDDLVTTLVYLDEATEQNGCLQVLPRHHCHYFNHALPDGTFAGMITEDIGSGRFGQPVSLAAPAGSVIFMHCVMPHSSLPNRSAKPRRTLIFEYRAADAFPVFYGRQTLDDEAGVRPLRGKPARVARFGGPPPVMPNHAAATAIYDLQADSAAKLKQMHKPMSMT
jgi:ectoine hydroxylase-related dioxygenase (phytanoyl-CoA dioxygenase family)